MTPQDQEAFFEMWRAAREEYNRPVTAGGLEIAFRCLARFDFESVSKAIVYHLNDPNEGKFPIQIAHVVAQLDGDTEARAAEAFSKLKRAMTEVGNYSDVVFDDAIIHAIVDNEGGWERVALMTDEDLKYFHARFMKQYASYVSKSGNFSYPRQLQGASNRSRISAGEDADPPAVVGERDKAVLVYRGGSDGKASITLPSTASKAILDEAAQRLEVVK